MKSKKLKRALGILLTLAMCLSLLPGMIAFADESYDLWVGGVQVTSANAGNILAGDAVNDGKASYDADTKTLTLSDANIDTGYQVGGQKAAVYTTDDLVLAGSGSMGGDDIGFGIYSKGDNSLTLNGDFSFQGTLNGIYTFADDNQFNELFIEGGNVTAVGGTNGIFVSLNSSITVNGGNVTATGHGASNAHGYGIQAETLTINGGSLMATGGTSGNPGNGLGVEALTVSGGSVTAVGNSGALYAAPTLGSNVTAVASANINGTGYAAYNASQNNSYKWFQATEAYDLYVGGTQVTSLNASDVLGDGKVSYDADTNTLTLDGANITSPYNPKGKQYYGIFAKDIADLHIVAEGDSVINIPHQESSNTVRALSIQNTSASKATITCNGNLTVKAETSGISISQTELTVNGSGTLAVESQYAVSGNNALNIDGNVTVNLTANTGAPAALLGEGGSFSVDVGENAALNINCTYWGTQRVTSISSQGTTSITSTGAYGIFGYDTQTAVSVTGGNFSVSGTTKALRDASVTVNDGLAIYAGENGTSAVKQSGKTYSADAKYVSVKAPATYTVNITPGTNMTKTSGEELQTVGEGEAITDVVYTADTGCFPDTYSVETVNGITVTRNSATQITVSGTPTAAANITLTAPSEHQAGEATSENEVSATCTEQGSYDNVTYCKYCGVELSRDTKYTDPLGHNFGAPSYEWSADNKSVTGKRTCGRDASHIDAETVNTTSEITKPATLTEPGEHTYTATFTKTGFTTQTRTVADIPVLTPYEIAFAVTNVPKGGEKTATIGNSVEVTSDSTEYFVLPDQYASSVSNSENFNWFEGTFQKSTTYYASALIIPLGVDLLNSPLQFDITGGTFIKSEPTYTADGEPTGEVKVYFSVPVTEDADEIDTVAFTGVTLPKGGDAFYVPELADGEHYTVSGAYWTDENDEIPSAFDSGKDYYLNITLAPERGYVFADSINASLNGAVETVTPAEILGKTEIKIKVPVTAITTYTITFNANGGSVGTASDVTGADGKLATLPTPTRSSYNFNGWFTAASGGTKVTTDTVFDADTEIFAQWTRKSGGGGGGVTTYAVTPAKADNGSVTTSPKNASRGSTVTITVTPDEGYKLDKITVTDQGGKDVAVTEKDGKYTFTMPAGKVDVTPVFVKDDSEPTTPPTDPTTPPTDPTTPPADNDNPFTDVATGDYFYDAVLWAAKENITSGTTDTTFSPNESCTRGQTVTFLWREAGSPEPTSTVNPFTDVKTGDYFYKAVLWAYENGITKGTSDTEFSPNATVTRGQTVTFLYRMKGEKTNGENPFTDVKAEDYYYDSVLWAYENDITSGTSATTFSPNDNCLRGQIVTFLYRCNQ